MNDKKTYSQRIEDGTRQAQASQLEQAESNNLPIGTILAARAMLKASTDPSVGSRIKTEEALKSICLEFDQENLDLLALLRENEEACSFFIRNARDFIGMNGFEEAVITALNHTAICEFFDNLGVFLNMKRFDEAISIIEQHQLEMIEDEEPDCTYIMDSLDDVNAGQELELAKNLDALSNSIKRVQAATEEKAINLIKTDREFAEYFMGGSWNLSTMSRLSEAKKLAEEKIKNQKPK